MADDVKRALAFVARRQGARRLAQPAWGHILSLDLGWMDPAQARAMVSSAVAAGLLQEEPDGMLRLAVDPTGVEVPRGFRPDPGAVAEPPGPAGDLEDGAQGFLQWAGRVAEARGVALDRVLEDVARAQERMGGHLTADAAVLWLAAEAGLDVRTAARLCLEGMLSPVTMPAPEAGAPR